jgi:hypothetical protein
MSKFREKAEAQTEQIIGQMLGDELLVREGQERLRSAETDSGASDDQRAHLAQDKTRSDTMPRENDLEGAWDQGGKHGGQKGMPRPEPRPEPKPDPHRAKDEDKGVDQGIVRDERGQEQPRDKARAQQVSRVDKGGDPPGKKA